MGSTQFATDASRAVVGGHQLRYTAYGSEHISIVAALPTAYTFTGQKQDGTGLIYMNARYYDPQLGTFISPDSLVPDPTSLAAYNRYLYAQGNPLRYTDPTGHDGVPWDDGQQPEWWAAPVFGSDGEALSARNIAIAEENVWRPAAAQGNAPPVAADAASPVNSANTANQVVNLAPSAPPLGESGIVGENTVTLENSITGNSRDPALEQTVKETIGNLPNNPSKLSNEWKDVTPAGMRENTSLREYQNVKTGLTVRFDPGTPGENGFAGKDHWHVYNPDGTGKGDLYLDINGNPVPKNSNPSYIIPE